MASIVFDASTVDPSKPRDIIPPGKYLAQIVASEMRATNNGDGQYLQLEHEILDGEHKGRRIWNNLNLVNNNAKAVEIAQRDLSAICHAIGQMHVTDSEQLHFKPFVLTVKVKPEGPDKQGIIRPAKNEVGGYEPASGAAPIAQQARPQVVASNPAPAAQAAQPKRGVTPPWKTSKAS